MLRYSTDEYWIDIEVESKDRKKETKEKRERREGNNKRYKTDEGGSGG